MIKAVFQLYFLLLPFFRSFLSLQCISCEGQRGGGVKVKGAERKVIDHVQCEGTVCDVGHS